MLELKSEFLCSVDAELDPAFTFAVGVSPLGQRVIAGITGGTVSGPRVNGRILPSGADWLLIDAQGIGRIDVRVAFELDDGSVAYATYGGRLIIPPEHMAAAFNRATVESVDPSAYYFRTAPTFETASTKYAWLNRVQAVGIGRLTSKGVAYAFHEVL
jgi:hypothetical protein